MKTRTLLIDGSYLLKRSFHGAKNTYTTNYGNIGCLYQFMTTLRMLVKQHMSNKVIIFWDGQNGGVMRHRIDIAYKSNRKNKEWYKKIEMSAAEIRREEEKEESILKNRISIKNYIENLFIRQIECADIEADDLIAAYCIEHNNKEELVLFSNDRDFAQLLDLNLTIIFPNINQPVTKSNYIMHFDHHYSNALVLKIICGDTADDIKGVGGIKEKTLLEHFPELKYKHLNVRDICKRADEINQERVQNKLKPLKALNNLITPEGIKRLKTNYQLTNLREPMLNEQAREELKQLELPLSPEDRGSKNLYKMMIEDDFLSVYGSTFPNYVEPFYTVIMNEKQLLTEYIKNNKKSF